MKFKEIADYIKLEHTVFDVPFIVSGSFIAANGYPGTLVLILVILAGSFARATGMSINRILGRKYDIINPRKKDWALVKGSFTVNKAIGFTVISAFLFETCAFFLNRLVFELSPIVLALFIIDPLLKKITMLRHFFMGLVIGVGVMAGYLAVNPSFPAIPEIYILILATGLWIAGFDMIYTIPDIKYDRQNGLKTVMSKSGIKKGIHYSESVHAVTGALFLSIAFFIKSYIYLAAATVIIILIIYQHVILKPDDPKSIRVSFLNSNSFIGFIFLAGVILSIYVH
ncbi:MAG: prenyltransferase [Thermoplasmatales archaeon E-plasma]|jgi:4-hydroxybenzoate octaprenyltransferase (EC 2.5.1.-)|nr:MAG: prenyltransferase [Thermoplasmatales archaeon E-plasma]